MAERVSDAELKTIYRETIDSLYAFASRRCGGQRELAEDVVQEAWLRAVRTWGRTGVPNVPLAWLTTVARNLILNSQRRLLRDRSDRGPLRPVFLLMLLHQPNRPLPKLR